MQITANRWLNGLFQGVVEATEEGRTAILQSDFSARAIIESLDQLVAAPGLRSEMGAAGRERVVELFSLQAQAEAWRSALLRIF